MKRKILLIFLFCGLAVLSVVLEYHAAAEPFDCQVSPVCFPETPLRCETIECLPHVQPPDCEPPDCDVSRPLLRGSCARAWQEHLISDAMRSPQQLCFVDVKIDKLNTVAMVSTADILRALSR